MSGSKGTKLPKAVQKQGEAADEALKAMMQNDQGGIGGPGAGSGDPGPDTDDGAGVGSLGSAGEQPIPDQGAGNVPDQVDWKAEAEALREERNHLDSELKTLRGKYNAEVPRLTDQLRELREELNALKTAGAHQPPKSGSVDGQGQAAGSIEGLNIDELRDTFGQEFVTALLAVKQQAVAEARREFEPKLRRVDDIEQRAAEDAEAAMYAAIAKEHSDWEKIDKLATWRKFLAEVNPDTGEPRQQAINRALMRLDPGPIIRQLSTFKRRHKSGSQALESQQVPGDDGRPEPPAQRDQKVYSKTEIDLFFRRMATKASRNVPPTDDEKRLEAQYTMAMREGRVN